MGAGCHRTFRPIRRHALFRRKSKRFRTARHQNGTKALVLQNHGAAHPTVQAGIDGLHHPPTTAVDHPTNRQSVSLKPQLSYQEIPTRYLLRTARQFATLQIVRQEHVSARQVPFMGLVERMYGKFPRGLGELSASFPRSLWKKFCRVFHTQWKNFFHSVEN